jgi:hypothetical protein
MFVPWARGVQEYVNFKLLLLFIIIFIIIDIIVYHFLTSHTLYSGASGGVVVKALRYKPAG